MERSCYKGVRSTQYVTLSTKSEVVVQPWLVTVFMLTLKSMVNFLFLIVKHYSVR